MKAQLHEQNERTYLRHFILVAAASYFFFNNSLLTTVETELCKEKAKSQNSDILTSDLCHIVNLKH